MSSKQGAGVRFVYRLGAVRKAPPPRQQRCGPACDANGPRVLIRFGCLHTLLHAPAAACCIQAKSDPHAMPDFSRAAVLVPIAGALIGLILVALVLAIAANLGPRAAARCNDRDRRTSSSSPARCTRTGSPTSAMVSAAAPIARAQAPNHERQPGSALTASPALVLSQLMRIGTLAGLIAIDVRLAAAVIVAVAALSRTAGLLPLVLLPPARTLGAGFRGARPAAR